MSSRIFISYAPKDHELANELESQLEYRGVSVIRDKDVIRGGKTWEGSVLNDLPTCDKLVLLWSKAASETLPVIRELVIALERKVEVLPISLDETPPNALLHSVTGIDGQRLDMNLIVDAIVPRSLPTAEFDSQISSLLRQYRRFLMEEVSRFPVLLIGRKDTTEHVIPLNVNDELNDDAYKDPQRQNLDIVSMLPFAPSDSTLLLGHPGSGKSTTALFLIRHLLASENTFSDKQALPFTAHCKRFNPRKYESILDFMYSQAVQYVNFQIAEALRANGVGLLPNAVFIIDGFDELPSGTSEAFLERLSELRADPDFSGHVLLTSRFDAYRQYEHHFRGWHKLTLAPLSPDQINTFVCNWFGAGETAQTLLNQIREPRLAELAIRPFLLAMMCLVKEEGGDLGKNRSELYSRAVGYLERRQVTAVEASLRTLRRQVLEDLSFRMLQFGTPDIDKWSAAGITARVLSESSGNSPTSFDDCVAFMDELSRDVGITQVTFGRYSFVHRTFMEYLAACKLDSLDQSLAVCLEHCNVARWEEPIRLYTGLQTDAAKQTDILQQLWKHNSALALRCLTDARIVNGSVIKAMIEDSDSVERVRMLRTLRMSLRDVDQRTRTRLVVETTEPLLREDSDNEVAYNAVTLLRWVDPEDQLRVLWNSFGVNSAPKRQQLASNAAMCFTLVDLPAGTFVMGDDSAVDDIEKPAHPVTVNDFKINRYQTINLAYEHVTGREPALRHPVSSRDKQPVVGLSWFDAFMFALRIGCRLPTEAEWEYAARAGSTTAWCYGDDVSNLPEYANFEEEGKPKSGPWDVGSGLPNQFGLYDMHGNIWEWCSDYLGDYSSEHQVDPQGPSSGVSRVRRGGGFAYHARGCRSAFRWGNEPYYRFKDIGIRVVLDKAAVDRGW